MCITLFCTFLCLPWITTTWNDQILSLLYLTIILEDENGKAINSTISVLTRARSSLFRSSINVLLSPIFQRRFRGRRRFFMVRSPLFTRVTVPPILEEVQNGQPRSQGPLLPALRSEWEREGWDVSSLISQADGIKCRKQALSCNPCGHNFVFFSREALRHAYLFSGPFR